MRHAAGRLALNRLRRDTDAANKAYLPKLVDRFGVHAKPAVGSLLLVEHMRAAQAADSGEWAVQCAVQAICDWLANATDLHITSLTDADVWNIVGSACAQFVAHPRLAEAAVRVLANLQSVPRFGAAGMLSSGLLDLAHAVVCNVRLVPCVLVATNN